MIVNREELLRWIAAAEAEEKKCFEYWEKEKDKLEKEFYSGRRSMLRELREELTYGIFKEEKTDGRPTKV